MGQVVNTFQKMLSSYSNFLPDRDKIHLFAACTTAVAFALGTRINPTVIPYVQTYKYDRNETPKYKEAILITKKSDDAIAYSEEDRKEAAKLRKRWANLLKKEIKNFVTTNENLHKSWYEHISQKNTKLKKLYQGKWVDLPQLSKTSLKNDSIDLKAINVNGGFAYNSSNLEWKIDDGMFVSLHKRLSKIEGADMLQAGRLFLFHESLHYSPNGHSIVGDITNGIGQFPKVIEEADYQADVYALLYEYKYSQTYNSELLNENLKKFFATAIETATETMWSFVDNDVELTEIQVRSMNRFLNWYWQAVRIEQLEGTGTLEAVSYTHLTLPTTPYV